MSDAVNHPGHYQAGGFEAIDVLEAFFPDDPLGWQVGKYLLRYKKKNGLEDLLKARVYLERLIDRQDDDAPAKPVRDLRWIVTPSRQWPTLGEVPFGVPVVDKDGDHYSHNGNNWFWVENREAINDDRLHEFDTYGPFEEVIR